MATIQEVTTCVCPAEVLQKVDICPRRANSFDGPEEDGWSMMLQGDCKENISHCPFCGRTLEGRPDPWPTEIMMTQREWGKFPP